MRYAIRRFFTFFVSFWLVSLLTFLAFNIIPGDPAQVLLGTSASPKQLALLHRQLGLDQPLVTRYFHWLGGFLTGHLGNSLRYTMPITDLLSNRLPISMLLTGLAFLLVIGVSFPIGVFLTQKRDTALSRIGGVLNMFSISVPNFFLGVLFIWVFGIVLHFFVPGKAINLNSGAAEILPYLFFPALAIALPNIAVVVKFLQGSLTGQMRMDYIRTARSKGNSERMVLYRHALKNAVVPVITLLGMVIPEIFSGSILIEQVFGIPGVGRLLISSITSRDFPLVETLVVFIAVIVIVSNFLVDILLQCIDPRIRVG